MTALNHTYVTQLKSVLKWTAVLALILLVIFIVSINVFSYLFVGKETAIRGYFENLGVAVDIQKTDWNTCSLRYASTGIESDSATLLFFIHGAPGSLDNFREYMADSDLRRQFRMVSMDRPGYGGSCPGKTITDIAQQAEAAIHILKTIPHRNCFIFSHSYGCPIAGKIAADHPDLVDGIIMCAPLNNPDAEPMKWYSILADLKLSRLILPEFVEVATDEKMKHAEALRRIENDWKSIRVPVMHIHGKKDGLAPYEENIRFSKEHIDPALLTIHSGEKMGHLNIWLNAGFIKEKLLDFISKNTEK